LTLEKQDLNIQEQTEECFKNINRILKELNLTEANVVKANVYLTGMKHFEGMNEVYKTRFTEPYPARTCVAVFELPLGADVEIEVVAKR
jgi:2-iminobutanoate/2-iminopropanoate deaminase